MDKSQAQISLKNLVTESFSLSPSALISLYEIDIGNIAFDSGIITQEELNSKQNTVFRFHNSINLISKSIFWQGNEYIATPIMVDGMEIGGRTQTNPRLLLTSSSEGIPLLAQLKEQIRKMGDIIGGRFTRIRTFAKFLDAINFETLPVDFSPDPLSEFPRDVFFIDRKSGENKNTIEYELSSLYEIENVKLPARIVSQDNCGFHYRGDGCLYEYAGRKTHIHGGGALPLSAPPVATIHNEKIIDILGDVLPRDKGAYIGNTVYNKGDSVYIEHQGIKYYFVSKINNNISSPLSTDEWIVDECSKKVKGCRLRYADLSIATPRFVHWVAPQPPQGATIKGDPGTGLIYHRFSAYANPNEVEVKNAVHNNPTIGTVVGFLLTGTPSPVYSPMAHVSLNQTGRHQHYYFSSPTTFTVSKDESIVTYVYLLGPLELLAKSVMLQFHVGDPASAADEDRHHGWRRAYWGENLIGPALNSPDNNFNNMYMGPLPATGKWVKLKIPATTLELQDKPINGIAFTLFSGSAAWDALGKETSVDGALPFGGFPSVNRFR